MLCMCRLLFVFDYLLLDSGNERKLERFGPYVVARPCSQALWTPSLSREIWQAADATLWREGEKVWVKNGRLPDRWTIQVAGLSFHIQPTEFGHLGKLEYAIPLNAIEKALWITNDREYGIQLTLTSKGELFLPFFSEQGYRKLQAGLDDVVHPDEA